MKRTVIYASEGDKKALALLQQYRDEGRFASFRNADLFEGVIVDAQAAIIFPNPHAAAIAEAHAEHGIPAELVTDDEVNDEESKGVKDAEAEGIKADARKGAKGRKKQKQGGLISE